MGPVHESTANRRSPHTQTKAGSSSLFKASSVLSSTTTHPRRLRPATTTFLSLNYSNTQPFYSLLRPLYTVCIRNIPAIAICAATRSLATAQLFEAARKLIRQLRHHPDVNTLLTPYRTKSCPQWLLPGRADRRPPRRRRRFQRLPQQVVRSPLANLRDITPVPAA